MKKYEQTELLSLPGMLDSIREECESGRYSSAFASDTARQLDILGHYRDALGVNCAQVGVLEKTHQVRFGRFLQGSNGG